MTCDQAMAMMKQHLMDFTQEQRLAWFEHVNDCLRCREVVDAINAKPCSQEIVDYANAVADLDRPALARRQKP